MNKYHVPVRKRGFVGETTVSFVYVIFVRNFFPDGRRHTGMSDTAGSSEAECLAVWCEGDDWCAVTCTVELIGKKWHPVIIHRLLRHDALRFNELSEEVGPITNKMLSQSLEDLEEKGLVDREIVSEKPVAVEYSLTPRGESLESVVDALETWGKTHLQPAESEAESAC
jgi:DNA-binding HxlR family transcriptional regulator